MNTPSLCVGNVREGGGGGDEKGGIYGSRLRPRRREEAPTGNALSAFALYSLSERRERAPPTVLFALSPSSSLSSSLLSAATSRSKAIGAMRRDVT